MISVVATSPFFTISDTTRGGIIGLQDLARLCSLSGISHSRRVPSPVLEPVSVPEALRPIAGPLGCIGFYGSLAFCLAIHVGPYGVVAEAVAVAEEGLSPQRLLDSLLRRPLLRTPEPP